MTVDGPISCKCCPMERILISLTPTEAELLCRALSIDFSVSKRLLELLEERLGAKGKPKK